MAKETKPTAKKRAAPKPAGPDGMDDLIREAAKKQEIAKAIAISRAADFTGKTEKAAVAGPRSSFEGSGASNGRQPALSGEEALGKGVRVSVLPPAERISLRAPAASVASLSKALGISLPTKPKTSASGEGRSALWLGPDEWLVIDEAGGGLVRDCGQVKALHSAVDISHRNVAMLVAGKGAEATLSAGCPQNLSLDVFPIGACSRTILGKVEIVVLRMAEDAFRVECWRSFSDYVFGFLADAAKDAAA